MNRERLESQPKIVLYHHVDFFIDLVLRFMIIMVPSYPNIKYYYNKLLLFIKGKNKSL